MEKEIQVAVIAFVGVALGALLTPFVSAKLEKAKIRRKLEPKLVKIVYLFYDNLIKHTRSSNMMAIHAVTLSFAHEGLLVETDSDQKKVVSDNIALHKEEYDRQLEETNEYNLQMARAESKIYTILLLIRSHINESRFNKLKNLLEPVIGKGTAKRTGLYKYQTMNHKEYLDIYGEIPKAIFDAQENLIQERDRLINKMVN